MPYHDSNRGPEPLPPINKRLAICPRVSSADQERDGYGLDIQEEALGLWARLHGYTIPRGCVYAGDESGRIALESRPIYQRMLADARAGMFDAVAYFNFKRVARKLKYQLQVADELQACGIALVVVEANIDTSTPAGRFIRNIMAAEAEYDGDRIVEQTAEGRAHRLAQRRPWLCGVHYGYRYERQDRGDGLLWYVVRHDGEAEVVRRIYRRRAQGASWERIAAELTADGIPTPKDVGAWHWSTVQKMVQNTAYMGQGSWGKRVEYRTPNGKRSARLRRDGASLHPMSYPVIVDPPLWDAANAVSARTRHPVRAGVDRYLLRAGMLRCADHDATMSGSANGSGQPRYRCYRAAGGTCTTRRVHSLPAPALDAAVWAEVVAFCTDGARARAAIEDMLTAADRDAQAAAREAQDARDALREASARIDWLLREGMRGRYDRDRLDALMAEAEGDQVTGRERLARAEAAGALAAGVPPAASDVERVLADAIRGAAGATPEQRRAILDGLQVRVEMRGDAYEIGGVVPGMVLRGTLEGAGPGAQDGGGGPGAGTITGSPGRGMHPVRFVLRGHLAA